MLLGSGVSRSAGIPTGWDVVLDLVRKLARLVNDDAGDDPQKWFTARYAEPLTYTALVFQDS